MRAYSYGTTCVGLPVRLRCGRLLGGQLAPLVDGAAREEVEAAVLAPAQITR